MVAATLIGNEFDIIILRLWITTENEKETITEFKKNNKLFEKCVREDKCNEQTFYYFSPIYTEDVHFTCTEINLLTTPKNHLMYNHLQEIVSNKSKYQHLFNLI